jgi:hypothetical protein
MIIFSISSGQLPIGKTGNRQQISTQLIRYTDGAEGGI